MTGVLTIKKGGPKFGGTYHVYPKAEADQAGIDYIDWRDASETGQWVISDDGYVMRVLDHSVYQDRKDSRKRQFMVLPIARIWITPNKRFDARPFLEGGAYYRTSPNQDSQSMAAKTTRAKLFVQMFVAMALSGHFDLTKLGRTISPKATHPWIWAKRFLKNEKVKNMIREEMTAALERGGVDAEYLVKRYKDAVDVAELNGKAGDMVKAIDRLCELADAMPAPGRLPGPGGMQEAQWSEAGKDIQAAMSQYASSKPKLPKVETPSVLLEDEI